MFMNTTGSPPSKPRILLLIDRWNWAFHIIARAISQHLSDRYDCEILCTADAPFIDESRYDIVHVFFETETYHRAFLHGRAKVVKGVYSHYWQMEGLSPEEFYAQSLSEADAIAVPSRKLLEAFWELPCPVYLFPEGVDTDLFTIRDDIPRTQDIGWAGSDFPVKRLGMLREACEGLVPLRTSISGDRTEAEMPAFYNAIDVIANASVSEGCPRPILEGMACGAFPVMFDVGIAREIIRSGHNGLIVENQSATGLRDAFVWCAQHRDIVERARPFNRELIRSTRRTENVIPSIADIYASLLA